MTDYKTKCKGHFNANETEVKKSIEVYTIWNETIVFPEDNGRNRTSTIVRPDQALILGSSSRFWPVRFRVGSVVIDPLDVW
jgi:hypothetical protein